MRASPIAAIVRVDGRWYAGRNPARVVVARGGDAFTALDEIGRGGFWVGFLAYDLGRSVELFPPRTVDDLGLPDLAFARFDDLAPLDDLTNLAGGPLPVQLGAGRSSMTSDEFARGVADIHALLDAGECYQVNLTRRLTFAASPDPVAMFGALAIGNPAPYASLCTFGDALPDVAVVSASPELYLRIDGERVVTRPIKGTARDAGMLATSAKDHAENIMIVDLARNDLGRVCTPGSIRVPDKLAVEAHPGLHHLVSTVEGTVRPGIGLGDVVRATFPPASVTGAPKPRVLRAIEDLEPVRRGVYCGAVGWIDATHDRAELAVAIRTFTITPDGTHLGVGAGIVADSRAEAEWTETELKAARLLRAVGAYEAEPAVVS